MKQLPAKYLACEVAMMASATQANVRGRWVPARPEPYWHANPLRTLLTRLRLAWAVFTGRCDALDWEH